MKVLGMSSGRLLLAMHARVLALTAAAAFVGVDQPFRITERVLSVYLSQRGGFGGRRHYWWGQESK